MKKIKYCLLLCLFIIVGCDNGKVDYKISHPQNIERYKLVDIIINKNDTKINRDNASLKLLSLAWNKPVDKVCLYDGGIKKISYFLLFKYLREYKPRSEEEGPLYTERFKEVYWSVIKYINLNFDFAKIKTTQELKDATTNSKKVTLIHLKDNSKILYLTLESNKYILSP